MFMGISILTGLADDNIISGSLISKLKSSIK